MITQHPAQQIYSFFQLAVPVGFKVLMAILCGGLIGLEREIKSKPAGLKTNILICLGSTLYTTISILMAQSFSDTGYHGDPARVAAQIVSGIGFLGAGAIMQGRGSIAGLTTAATIWVVAAIGVCVGAGYPVVGFVFTLTVLFTLLAIDRFETKYILKSGNHALEITFDDEDGSVRGLVNNAMEENEIALDDFDISHTGHRFILKVQYSNSSSAHKKFILDLWGIKGIREVKQF